MIRLFNVAGGAENTHDVINEKIRVFGDLYCRLRLSSDC